MSGPKWRRGDPPVDAPFFFTWTAQSDATQMVLKNGNGSRFSTADGGQWLDFASYTYQANIGHGHPRLINAIQRQAADLCVAMPNAVYDTKIELAEALLELAPDGFSKVFFTLGGAEANENAIKMARLFTGRHKLLSRYRSYHGATMGALSLTGDYRRPPLEPGLVGVVHAMDCYCHRCPFGQELSSCKQECATHISDLLDLEGQGSIAAVILEPIPGANGVLVPPAGYWQTIREACDRHGTLLVADEVLTGFGRTGRWLAIEHEGVVPDLITVAKGLTGGYGSLGAVLVHERVAAHFEENTLYAGLTAYAHPLACAAALEAIRVYRDEGLIERAAELEKPFLEGLRQIQTAHPTAIRDVRGRGLLGVLELTDGADGFARLAKALAESHLLTHLRASGPFVILSPPLCLSHEELSEGLELLEGAVVEAFS